MSARRQKEEPIVVRKAMRRDSTGVLVCELLSDSQVKFSNYINGDDSWSETLSPTLPVNLVGFMPSAICRYTDLNGTDGDEAITEAIVQALDADKFAGITRSYHSINWSRNLVGGISVTAVERRELSDFVESESLQYGGKFPVSNVESPTRALARAWLWFRMVNGEDPAPGYAESTTLFLAVSQEVVASGYWTPDRGFVHEAQDAVGATDLRTQLEWIIIGLTSSQSLEEYGLPQVGTIVVADLSENPGWVLDYVKSKSPSYNVVQLGGFSSVPEASPSALFLAGAVLDDDIVPRINLVEDLSQKMDAYENQKKAQELVVKSAKELRALVQLLAPIAVCMGLFVGWMFALTLNSWSIAGKKAAATQEGLRLQKEVADFNSAKVNFDYYRDLTSQTLKLRDSQPSIVRLLADLDSAWPVGDSTWFVTEVETLPGGKVVIKGKTHNQDSVASFVRSLELGQGLFTNIQPDSHPATNGVITNPKEVGLLLFSVTALYKPLAALTPAPKPVESASAPASDVNSEKVKNEN